MPFFKRTPATPASPTAPTLATPANAKYHPTISYISTAIANLETQLTATPENKHLSDNLSALREARFDLLKILHETVAAGEIANLDPPAAGSKASQFLIFAITVLQNGVPEKEQTRERLRGMLDQELEWEGAAEVAEAEEKS